MNLFFFRNYIGSFFQSWTSYILRYVYQEYLKWKIPVKKTQILRISDEEMFILPIKKRFLDREKTSSNICFLFYKKNAFQEYMKNPNTNIEKTWKSRIQMTYTPRGNIIMFYDAYKLGFSYYCDHNVVSYDILNAVAMRYVMLYNCAHFFIDEVVLPEETDCPLNIHYILENKPSQINAFKQINRKLPAANKNNEKKKEILRNKFIYLGTLRNFSICQKTQPVNEGFQSPLLDGLTGGQSERMNWAKFKASLLAPPLPSH